MIKVLCITFDTNGVAILVKNSPELVTFHAYVVLYDRKTDKQITQYQNLEVNLKIKSQKEKSLKLRVSCCLQTKMKGVHVKKTTT